MGNDPDTDGYWRGRHAEISMVLSIMSRRLVPSESTVAFAASNIAPIGGATMTQQRSAVSYSDRCFSLINRTMKSVTEDRPP